MKKFSYLWQYVAELFLEWCYKSKCYRRAKHILCSVTFFPRKSCRFWDNVDKCDGARGATNDDTIWRVRVQTPTRPGTRTRAHTQICNNYCFSTATMIRERASVLRYMYIACLFLTYLSNSLPLKRKSKFRTNIKNRKNCSYHLCTFCCACYCTRT